MFMLSLDTNHPQKGDRFLGSVLRISKRFSVFNNFTKHAPQLRVYILIRENIKIWGKQTVIKVGASQENVVVIPTEHFLGK